MYSYCLLSGTEVLVDEADAEHWRVEGSILVSATTRLAGGSLVSCTAGG